ncbi:hypothetical protein ONZ45_g9303 [Pleurotus djamor]|nr:hypothetical protein ONZ45_g9303 [Pleurotus djamor]
MSEPNLFLQRVAGLPEGPGVLLDDVLQPSLEYEAELRRLFATNRDSEVLNDLHVGLVDVFDAPDAIKKTRARVVKDEEEDLSAKHIMPLSSTDRRKDGDLAMVPSMEEFKKNWAVFSEGSLNALPLGINGWDNVVAAGGSVLACLTPLPQEAQTSKRNMRKWFHTEKYPTSDVDLFLYGMTAEQAEVRINEIYEAVRDSVPWDVTCVRTRHTVSIHSQYPYRSVQIVLRLYKSPAEILAGFDIDAPCVAYDGQKVWANPRSVVAMMRQANTVDMTRRSPSYEVRLCKYSSRGYEVYVPTLNRKEVDPTIYERAIGRITGLARLLVLEKLANPTSREAFLQFRRSLRGRPNDNNTYRRDRGRKYKGDLKTEKSILDDLAMNDYDVTSLHIPYGPGWDARRIDKLIYQTDLGMNSPFNPKNKERRLHRHPAFFGTMKEALDDCCECCPDPIDDDERELQKKEDDTYTRGRISFIEEDPGRQSMTGSFNPIDVGEWSEQAYIGPTEKFFGAIVVGDLQAIKSLIQEQEDLDAAEAAAAEEAESQKAATAMDSDDPEKEDEKKAEEEKKITHKQRYINRRDHVGRTALHFAILCKREEIACYLIDTGIRITSRIFDGRTALHMAVQLDQLSVVNKLLAKSKENEAAAIKAGLLEKEDVEMTDDADKRVRDSSDDDWSSENEDEDVEMTDAEDEDEDSDDDGSEKPKKKDAKKADEAVKVEAGAELPEPDEDDLDILDVNAPDWDLAFAPLHYAALFGSVVVVEALLRAKANVALATKADSYRAPAFLPLTLTVVRADEPKIATQVAETLIKAGARSSAADDSLLTTFHWAVASNQIRVVECILRCDEHATAVIDFPVMNWYGMLFPITTAISKGYYGMVALLLAHGAKLEHTEEELSEIKASAGRRGQNYLNQVTLTEKVWPPLEVAVNRFDPVIEILLAFGANCNVWLKASFDYSSNGRKTILDWIKGAIPWLDQQIVESEKKLKPETATKLTKDGLSAWELHVAKLLEPIDALQTTTSTQPQLQAQARIQTLTEVKNYLIALEKKLVANGAKHGAEIDRILVADQLSFDKNDSRSYGNTVASPPEVPYQHMKSNVYNQYAAPLYEKKLYDELYEACHKGDNAKIEELCMPSKTGQSKNSPLQIAVNMSNPDNRWQPYGFTPLYAAISAGHWQTARLIIAVAKAQYKEKEKQADFSTKDIALDSDDEGSECSDDSDMTVDQKEFEFVDIANRSSQVEAEVGPGNLLDTTFRHILTNKKGEKYVATVNFLQKAIYEGDLDTFKHVAALHAIANSKSMDSSMLNTIISCDRADILEEYIRRTGYGISIKLDPKDEEEVRAMNDGNRVYLGLNVHGKKRADLARKNDPNAQNHTTEVAIPLVWLAAADGAINILDYLHSSKPVSAFKHYATTAGDERALKLRRFTDLETTLPELLGWTINSLGESPLTAAIVSQKIEVLKHMYKLAPKLMSAGMKQRVKFVGMNPIQIAVYKNCDPQMIDFLLANGGDLFEHTARGNIFHDLCTNASIKLFNHLVAKLPRDVVVTALTESAKKTGRTPLHCAVENGFIELVELVIGVTKEPLVYRNLGGSTPLHSAISLGFPVITKILIDAGSEGDLATEDGVGDLPIETATFRDTVWRTREHFPSFKGDPAALPFSHVNIPSGHIFNAKNKQDTVPEFRDTVNDLIGKGKLRPDDKKTKRLLEFASELEKMLASESASQKKEEDEKERREAEEREKKGEVPIERDYCDRAATFKVVKEAATTVQANRQRVHLIDAQKVVMGGMPEGNAVKVAEWKDELEPEESEEEAQKRGSHMLRYIAISSFA